MNDIMKRFDGLSELASLHVVHLSVVVHMSLAFVEQLETFVDRDERVLDTSVVGQTEK